MAADRLAQVRMLVSMDMANIGETVWLEEPFATGLVQEHLAKLTGEVREADDGGGAGEGDGEPAGGDTGRRKGQR